MEDHELRIEPRGSDQPPRRRRHRQPSRPGGRVANLSIATDESWRSQLPDPRTALFPRSIALSISVKSRWACQLGDPVPHVLPDPSSRAEPSCHQTQHRNQPHVQGDLQPSRPNKRWQQRRGPRTTRSNGKANVRTRRTLLNSLSLPQSLVYLGEPYRVAGGLYGIASSPGAMWLAAISASQGPGKRPRSMTLPAIKMLSSRPHWLRGSS